MGRFDVNPLAIAISPRHEVEKLGEAEICRPLHPRAHLADGGQTDSAYVSITTSMHDLHTHGLHRYCSLRILLELADLRVHREDMESRAWRSSSAASHWELELQAASECHGDLDDCLY